jgi:AcrR family transcriptional regulator
VAEPAYTRMQVDDRRAQLVELGARLFTEHSFEELTMARIADEAGITKAALYHYFPSKQAYFEQTLRDAAAELARITEPDADAEPLEALGGSVSKYLEWIEANPNAYEKLIRSAGAIPEAAHLVDEVRTQSADRILAAIAPDGPTAKQRIAVRSWLWLMDGAILDWINEKQVDREELTGFLIGALAGALAAAA